MLGQWHFLGPPSPQTRQIDISHLAILSVEVSNFPLSIGGGRKVAIPHNISFDSLLSHQILNNPHPPIQQYLIDL